MWRLIRTFPLMMLVLAVPIVPFVFFGEMIEQVLRSNLASESDSTKVSLLIVVLLSTDIFLPIPSSVISTMSGWRLGWLTGTLVTWIGMTLGALAGYYLAWCFGSRFSKWFCRSDDLEAMQGLMSRFGPSVLIIGRAIPVFAEASVLMAGIHQLTWRRFFLPIVFSNFVIAVIYSSLGDLAARYQWLAAAVGVSIGIPVFLAAITRNLLSKTPQSSSPMDSDS